MDVFDEADFEFPFVGVRAERQEVKVVGVLEKLLSQVGLGIG